MYNIYVYISEKNTLGGNVMLVNFRVGNYLSYDQLSLFSMVTGKPRKHPKHVMKFKDVSILKFAGLYGANASGKSNLVKAIKFSKNVITKGIPDTITFDKYCKVKNVNRDNDSNFEYELVIDDYVYVYGFSINLFEKKVTKEWLYSLADNVEVELFTRELNGNENYFKPNYEALSLDQNDRTRLEIYIEDFKNVHDTLLIRELNKNKPNLISNGKASILNKLFYWFSEILEVISPDESPSETGLTYLRRDNGLGLVQFLDEFGTGIQEICTQEVHEKDLYKEIPSMIVKNILENIVEESNNDGNNHALLRTPQNIYEINRLDKEIQIKNITFKHATDQVTYTLGEESDGTVRLVELYDILANESEKIYVVDEIDRSLHPNLTHNFIKSYLNKKNNGQLIVTTHEDRLLDLDILRRDEIWFVEKQENGTSELYSLEKFKERFDRDILRAYLDGRYGSIPKFKFFN